MAEVEDRQFNSLAERIAALNSQKNFSSTGKRAPPPPPPGGSRTASAVQVANTQANGAAAAPSPIIPARPQKSTTSPPPALPRRTTSNDADPPADTAVPARRAPPPLPSRTNTETSLPAPSPALPPRRPSTQTLGTRRGSNASDMSYISTVSSLSLKPVSSRTSMTSTETLATRKLPPTLDQAKLPPLPPSKRDREAAEKTSPGIRPVRSIKSAPVVPRVQLDAKPSLPPRLPARPIKSPPQLDEQPQSPAPVQPRRLPPPPNGGFTKPNPSTDNRRPASASPDVPPPVPISSRPSATQIDAVATRTAANAVMSCLVCRDFSRPDAIAAQFPAHTLPRQDPVGYLANVLCGSFPSATDKARAVFTWCHHNIAYNVEEFYGNCIQRRSVEETIFHGKAVCQGYAEVYQSIAQRAGLQCILVSGHGKGRGYSHSVLRQGERPPPQDTNHAWNAVMIDNGEWKLLDACWGAGSVTDGNAYKQHFKPQMFYFSNEMFGLTHFPQDPRHFYRADGGTQTWDEYYIGPVASGMASTCDGMEEEGLSKHNFLPAEQHIPVYGGQEIVRFQFSKVCEHWDGNKHGSGPPYLLMVKIGGLDGRKDDFVPLDTDGYWYWCDIRARDLGAPGQKIFLYSLTSLNNKDARGVTKDEFLRAKGRSAMGWNQYVSWDLV